MLRWACEGFYLCSLLHLSSHERVPTLLWGAIPSHAIENVDQGPYHSLAKK